MHELSIAQALIEQIEDIAGREGAESVVSVTVQIGTLSGVEPDALEMAYPLASEKTVVEGATFHIEILQAEAVCRACGKASDAAFPFPACSHCASTDLDISAGRELLLKSVELNVPD